MDIDLHVKAQNLLEKLANSIHDRSPDNNQFCFNIAEVHLVEQWMEDIIEELEKPA